MSDSLQSHGLYSSRNSPSQNTGVGSLSLLQGIFPTQGSNPGLLHCRWILYQLSHQGSPRIPQWLAYPFFSGYSQPRNWNGGLLHCRWILYQLSYEGRLPTICFFLTPKVTWISQKTQYSQAFCTLGNLGYSDFGVYERFFSCNIVKVLWW